MLSVFGSDSKSLHKVCVPQRPVPTTKTIGTVPATFAGPGGAAGVIVRWGRSRIDAGRGRFGFRSSIAEDRERLVDSVCSNNINSINGLTRFIEIWD